MFAIVLMNSESDSDQSKMAVITGDTANSLVEADFSGQVGPGPRVNNNDMGVW